MRRSKVRGARAGAVLAVLTVMASALVATAPGAAAATSGGWSNLGHGAPASMPALNTKVETFTNVGGTLYVGGDFINAGGLGAADHIATWNGTRWAALGGGLGDAASAVYSIAVDPASGLVFAGGSFQNAGGDTAADRIAVFNGTTWTSLGGVGLNAPAFALTIIDGILYVGGSFDNVNGIQAADAVAAYSIGGGGWFAVTDASGDIGGTVSSLVPDGSGGLFMGGSFINADGIAAADFVTHWTGGTSWSALGATAAINDRVRALAISGNDLYVGGDFTDAGGNTDADRVAHWNGSSWSSVGPSVFGVGTSIYALAVDGGTVIAAGFFNNAGGQARMDGIAAFRDGSWTNVGTSANGANGPVSLNTLMTSLRVVGSRLYLGGLDSSIGDATMNGYAASFRLRQPDAQIASTAAFVGNGIYNTTGAQQARSRTVHRNQSGTFSVKIGNDGLGVDSSTVRGAGSNARFTVSYFSGNTNITAQVVAGTYPIADLAAGGNRTLTVKVRVAAGTPVGTSRSFLVTATSTGAGAPKDAVKATVIAS